MGNRVSIDCYNDEIGVPREPLKSIAGGERRYIYREEITIGIPVKAIAIIGTMTALIAAYMLLGTI